MFNFGLKPCPLCGGEASVAHLAQGPEEFTAVIKCTGCGLTLQWETGIKVGVSRSGKRNAVKAGLDPIEAWNRREMCKVCGERIHSEMVSKLTSCNDCGVKECPHKPRLGDMCRINCPLWHPKKKNDEMEAAEHGSN